MLKNINIYKTTIKPLISKYNTRFKMDAETKKLNSPEITKEDLDRLKNSMNDWIVFLDTELKQAKKEITRLRQKVERLEINRHRFP